MLKGVSPGKFLLTRIFVILALSITAHAQSTATLLGRIVDPDGASVIGAKITATNQPTGVNRVGRITNTRFPTGEMGSSRQIQFGTKLTF